MARLKEFYKTEVIKKMTEQFGYSSPMQVPRIEKITLKLSYMILLSYLFIPSFVLKFVPCLQP